MEKFLYILFFMHPFVLPSSGCIGVGTGGCRQGGLVFGGRLMFSGNGMNLPEINGQRVFIFQTPPRTRDFFGPAAGRGQIWIGRSSCRGTVPGHCPSTGTPPCFDSICEPVPTQGPPSCPLVLNVNEKEGVSLTFSWERPTCVPEDEALTYRYTLWMDGTTRVDTTTDTSEIFSSFNADSKYFFELNVTTSTCSFYNYSRKASPVHKDDTPLTFLDVTTTSVNVMWPAWDESKDKGLGPIEKYIIQYRLKGDSDFKRFSAGLNTQRRFDNLISGRTYEFQLIITSPFEVGEPSAIQEVEISCPAPTATSISLKSDYTNSVGIYANWSVDISEFCASSIIQTLAVQLVNRDNCGLPMPTVVVDEVLLGNDVRDYTLRNPPTTVHPNSNYSVTITVRNAVGEVNDARHILTAAAAPSIPPKLLNTTIKSSNQEITFEWDSPPCGGRNGDITKYEYLYRVWRNGPTEPAYGNSVVTVDKTVTLSFSPDLIYNFSVKASTAAGSGPYATLDPPSYQDVSPLTFPDVSSTSITVSWPKWDESVDYGQGPVEDIEYILLYRLKDEESTFMEVNKLKGTSHQLSISEPGALYEFRIKLVDNNPRTEGPLSPIQESVACEGLGDIGLQLKTARLSPGNVSLDMEWENPPETCNVISQTLIIHKLDHDNCELQEGHEDMRNIPITTNAHSLTGMQPNTNYNITLLMETGSGQFSVSETKRSAETEPTGEPSKIFAKERTGMITFRWGKPPCGKRNGHVTYVYNFIKNGVTEDLKNETNMTQITKQNLNEGNTYSFKVWPKTNVGEAPSYYREKNGTKGM